MLRKMPVPPSANQLYAFAKTYNRMVKTKVYREYEREVLRWRQLNELQIKDCRDFFRDLGNQVINVDATFYMPKTEIICKSGKPKRNDTSNRLKALHDVLSELIGIDDCYFWSGSFQKLSTDSEPYVDIKFRLRSMDVWTP